MPDFGQMYSLFSKKRKFENRRIIHYNRGIAYFNASYKRYFWMIGTPNFYLWRPGQINTKYKLTHGARFLRIAIWTVIAA